MAIEKDKKQHIASCAIVSACASLAVVATGGNALCACVAGAVAGVSCGIGKEYGDSLNPNNFWDNKDLLADIVGALAGSCVGLFALLR